MIYNPGGLDIATSCVVWGCFEIKFFLNFWILVSRLVYCCYYCYYVQCCWNRTWFAL